MAREVHVQVRRRLNAAREPAVVAEQLPELVARRVRIRAHVHVIAIVRSRRTPPSHTDGTAVRHAPRNAPPAASPYRSTPMNDRDRVRVRLRRHVGCRARPRRAATPAASGAVSARVGSGDGDVQRLRRSGGRSQTEPSASAPKLSRRLPSARSRRGRRARACSCRRRTTRSRCSPGAIVPSVSCRALSSTRKVSSPVRNASPSRRGRYPGRRSRREA